MAYMKWPVLRAPRRSGVAMDGTDDVVELTDAEWKRRMLAAQEGFVTEAHKFRDQDKTARIVQIAATLMIPVAAGIWRIILGRRTTGDAG